MRSEPPVEFATAPEPTDPVESASPADRVDDEFRRSVLTTGFEHHQFAAATPEADDRRVVTVEGGDSLGDPFAVADAVHTIEILANSTVHGLGFSWSRRGHR